VQRHANTLRKTLRHGTVRKRITVLQMALAAAVDWGWIGANAAQRISIKKDENPIDIDGLSDDESDRLLDAAAGRGLEHLLTVGVWTGLRKGELLGLRWQDAGHQRLNVRQTLVWRSGQPWSFKARPKLERAVAASPCCLWSRKLCRSKTPAWPSFARTQATCGPSMTWSSPARSAHPSTRPTSITNWQDLRGSQASNTTVSMTGATPPRPRCSARACPTGSSWRSAAVERPYHARPVPARH